MKIEEFLSPEDTVADLRAPDKARLLQDLAARAAARLGLAPQAIAQELLKREALGSTGMGNGIAIPHARVPGVDKPFGVFVRLKRAIDFEAIDGRPVDLVFLLVQPLAAQGDLNALASIARKLREPDRLEALRSAADSTGVFRELTR
jgi:PTS system nitrogen regulatory IIA component